MIKQHLIILACNLPWNWSTDYTNQTATLLNKNNFVICYMLTPDYSLKQYMLNRELPRFWQKKANHLFIFTPIHWLPFRRFNLITKANHLINVSLVKLIAWALVKTTKYKQKILWIFDPQYYSIYEKFGADFYWLYDMVDYFPGSVLDRKRSKFIRDQEVKLLKKAQLVSSISITLKKLNKRIRSNITIVPQGFRLEIYKKYFNAKPLIRLPRKKPILGYIGAINFRLDFDLLISIAKNNPNFNIILAGPIQSDAKNFMLNYKPKLDELRSLPNVNIYANQKRENVPALVKQFDICMIPYNSAYKFNRYSYPMKLFEYFYAGKPVISTSIKEIYRFRPYVKIAQESESWIKIIKQLIKSPLNNNSQNLLRKMALQNSWNKKIEALSQIIP